MLYFLVHLRYSTIGPNGQNSEPTVAYFIESNADPAVVQKRDWPKPIAIRPEARRRLELPTPSQSPEEPATPEPLTSAPITDWYSARDAAVDTVLSREQEDQNKHQFSQPTSSPENKIDPGVFGSEALNRRAGTWEGPNRVWISDNCYFDYEQGPPPPRYAGEVRLKVPLCKPPPSGGGHNMFDPKQFPPGNR